MKPTIGSLCTSSKLPKNTKIGIITQSCYDITLIRTLAEKFETISGKYQHSPLKALTSSMSAYDLGTHHYEHSDCTLISGDIHYYGSFMIFCFVFFFEQMFS